MGRLISLSRTVGYRERNFFLCILEKIKLVVSLMTGGKSVESIVVLSGEFNLKINT